jgi:hypothetical protein
LVTREMLKKHGVSFRQDSCSDDEDYWGVVFYASVMLLCCI